MGEYFSGVNIFQGQMFSAATIFSGVNILSRSNHRLNIWLSHNLLGLVPCLCQCRFFWRLPCRPPRLPPCRPSFLSAAMLVPEMLTEWKSESINLRTDDGRTEVGASNACTYKNHTFFNQLMLIVTPPPLVMTYSSAITLVCHCIISLSALCGDLADVVHANQKNFK